MILVFAGAGASKAVNATRYPTTIEFYQRLPEKLKDTPLFRLAVEYLKTKQKTPDPLDIEQVLWLMKDLREFTSKVSDPGSVPGWFVQDNRLIQLTSPGVSYSINKLLEVGNAATVSIDALSSEINARVYDEYRDRPSKDELESNWLHLLRSLMATGQALEIATTNYDIIAEEAIKLAKAPVLTGRTTEIQPTLDTTMWELRGLSVEQFSSYGRLTKLHGSVDWTKGRDRIYVGTPVFGGKHEQHAIIYPGFKGPPTDTLFQQLHRYFQERLKDVEIALFIGYAFRDDYINQILERNLSRAAKIAVINPAESLPGIPFPLSRFTHFKDIFDQQGIDNALEFIEQSMREV
jgi:hypothetical protein